VVGHNIAFNQNEVSCINCRVIYDYIQTHAPLKLHLLYEDLPPPFDTIDNPKALLTDENNWVTSAVIVKLFENAKKILEDPGAAFKIGFESVKKKKFGYIQKLYISTFSSPISALERLNHINSKFNTTKIVETVYATIGSAVIKLHWKEGRILSKDICLYNQGIYTAVPTIWGMPPAQLEETSCYFNGDPYCRYKITWTSLRGIKRLLYSFSTKKGSLIQALEEIEKDKQLIKKKYTEVQNLNLELYDKITKLQALNKASNYLVSTQDIDKILKFTLNTTLAILKFDRAILMLIDKKNRFLEYSYAAGGRIEDIEKLKNYRIPLTREHNIMIKALKRKKPILIRDVSKAHLNPSNLIISEFRPTSFAICPLIAKQMVIGVLGADRRDIYNRITKADTELLSIFANDIAVALNRASLNTELKSSYISAVMALVRAIENKDPYTKGHSERVALLSEKIGKILNLPSEEIEYLRIGGILHDVGKIGIPESIVRSPKQLTKAEYNIIKLHPVKGEEILEPITFLKGHLYLVRNHHERYDGKGYPDKLKGDEIPLGAAIMAIADTFDAMISSRPYRKGISLKQAAKEIYRNSGTQFAPEVVEAFKIVFENDILLHKLQYLKK